MGVTYEVVLENRRRLLAQMMERAQEALRRLSRSVDGAPISRHLTLAARAGYALAKEEDGNCEMGGHEPQHVYCARLAAEAFPLPPKRVLREEPDPESAIVRWRCSDRGIEYNLVGGAGWQVLTQDGTVGKFAITGPRIDLWHSLKHNPYCEAPDNGDE